MQAELTYAYDTKLTLLSVYLQVLTVYRIYRMSFRLACADPRSNGLGELGPSFHPICSSARCPRMNDPGTYHEYDLERSGYIPIFLSIQL
jgi:hypothetical protein